MLRYIAARLVQGVGVLFGTTIVLFLLLFVLPGDPFATLAGSTRSTDPVVRRQLESRYGLDRPLPVQYVRYVRGLVQGDLGESFRLRRPVTEVLASKAVRTGQLAGATMLVELALGIGAGVVAALSRRAFWDSLVSVTTTMFVALPAFVVALVLQDMLALRLRWLPIGGDDSPATIILPALTLAVVDAAIVARLFRGALAENVGAPYVRTARAKGVTRRKAVLHHAVPNSLLSVLTYAGVAVGTLLGGALLVEPIFDWDGLGSAMVTAVASRDHPVILGITVIAVTAFVLVNLVVDVFYGALDPRIRVAGRTR